MTTSKLSQESFKAVESSQGQTLGFPVVKDPNDPNTILRLSEKSGRRSGTQKHVSFDIPRASSVLENGRMARSSLPQSSMSRSSTQVTNFLRTMESEYGKPRNGRNYAFGSIPPSKHYVVSNMQRFGLPPMIYQDAYYSDELDTPDRAREWAGREFRLESLTVPFLPDFDPTATSDAVLGEGSSLLPDWAKQERQHQIRRQICGIRSWVIADPPPTYTDVAEWGRKDRLKRKTSLDISREEHKKYPRIKSKLSQIDGPTQKNKHGFKYTQDQKSTSVQHEAQYMSTMSLEVHINTRGGFVPNPEEDEVQ